MKPQENKMLLLRRAISTHEEAEAAILDLLEADAGGRYEALMERVRQNLRELRLESESSRPEDRA